MRWTVQRIWKKGTLEVICSKSVLIKICNTKTNKRKCQRNTR